MLKSSEQWRILVRMWALLLEAMLLVLRYTMGERLYEYHPGIKDIIKEYKAVLKVT